LTYTESKRQKKADGRWDSGNGCGISKRGKSRKFRRENRQRKKVSSYI
jgi:hypothetical protein